MVSFRNFLSFSPVDCRAGSEQLLPAEPALGPGGLSGTRKTEAVENNSEII